MNKLSTGRAALIILDGWGINPDPAVSAIARAETPFVDSLYRTYPNATLKTHAGFVGLPDGQMGNSEVGHMNLGAGRIVFQELLKINNAISSGSFYAEPVLVDAMRYARDQGRKLHFMGLVSDGGVHSHIQHLKALVDLAGREGVPASFVHIFTDGRDCDPHSGLGFVEELAGHCEGTSTQLASLVGRYYAMDRDKRWERIRKAYDLLVYGKGHRTGDIIEGIRASYAAGVTDEFIEPIVATKNGAAVAVIAPGDVVICFNFRTDRCRQITHVLTQEDMPGAGMHKLDLYYVTMTRYDDAFEGVRVVYDKEVLRDTLGEVVAASGGTQLRIAETEKYPHVTFFFNGGRETPFEGEERIMVNSPKVATYDLQPEMSAPAVTDEAVAFIHGHQPDFVCLNFANTDMVGHTGNFEAAMVAASTVDGCVKRVIEALLKYDYRIFLTADHGNADKMINEDGSPNTAHTKNLVPVFAISNDYKGPIRDGKLADLAPSILKAMGLEIPKAMTGEILIDL